jgi:hypothetical protein
MLVSSSTRSPLAAGALTEAEDNDGRTAQLVQSASWGVIVCWLHRCRAVPLYAASPGKTGTTGTTGDGHGQARGGATWVREGMEGPEGEKGGRERRMTLRLRSALRLRLGS